MYRCALLLCLACLPLWVTCATPDRPDDPPAPAGPADTAEATGAWRTGAAVAAADTFAVLHGQRIGLIGNHTSTVGDRHLADLLHEVPEVTLTALFGPEHGLRGTADAGASVADGRDPDTGVPIYSLYGETRRPTPAMLANLDVLVFDMQDVGARFYTYISTMGLAMQAAAEAELPFVVLDRPNPLGGTYVSGFVLEEEQRSFVGMYPIPIAHGLTTGELARMIRGEAWLEGLEGLDLTVVPMDGWQRSQRWDEGEAAWIPPSPNIPDAETAYLYPGTCFVEATAASEGRGTDAPFRLIGHPDLDGAALAADLNDRSLPGVDVTAASFTPTSRAGATVPKHRGTRVEGVELRVMDADSLDAVALGVHLLEALLSHGGSAMLERPAWLDRLAGTPRLREALERGTPAASIIADWEDEVARFKEARSSYLLYD
ncbi:MAG: DUF1343 domain-containing protein [Bacteroidetes bacterium]|jgi:uncharacterized protein YbbC (DUF1343 family)|nr:DUF1343 domain-containing protein [Bacteroidota bacterium]